MIQPDKIRQWEQSRREAEELRCVTVTQKGRYIVKQKNRL